MRPESSEPSLNDNAADALVARRDDALMTHHQAPRPGRRWPLWLCVLVLGSIVGWQQWQLQGLKDTGGNQRDQLTSRVAELEHSLANSAQGSAKVQEEVRSRIDHLSQQLESDVLPALTKVGQSNDTLGADVADQRTQAKQQLAEINQRFSDRETVHGNDMADLSAALDTVKSSVKGLRQSDENRDTLLTALQGSVSAIESLSRDGRAALNTRLDSQSNTLAHLENSDEQVGQQLNALAVQLGALAGKVEQHASRLSTLSSGHGESGKEVVELTRELETLKTRLASQQHSLEQLGKTLDTLPKAAAGLDNTAVSRLIEARVAPLAKAQTSLESQVGDIRRQQTAFGADMEAQAQDSNGDQLRSLEASRRQLSGRVASLLGQMSELQQRVTRLER